MTRWMELFKLATPLCKGRAKRRKKKTEPQASKAQKNGPIGVCIIYVDQSTRAQKPHYRPESCSLKGVVFHSISQVDARSLRFVYVYRHIV